MNNNICTKHLTWNCKICNPTPTQTQVTPGATTAVTPTNPIPTATPPPAPPSQLPPANLPPANVLNTSGVPIPTASIPAGPVSPTAPVPLVIAATPAATLKRPIFYGPKNRPKKRIKKTVIDDEVACQIFRQLRVYNNFLNCGSVLAWALQPDDEVFYRIHEYVENGQEHDFGVKVLSILRVMVKTENGDDPMDFNEDPKAQGKQRLMLWHGTRKPAVCSILQNGLRLPQLQAQMFGAGIYFADRVSKSCQYCGTAVGMVAFLFLCDVIVGNEYASKQAMRYITKPPGHHDSIRGCGYNVPDKDFNVVIDNCTWPLGKTIGNKYDIPPLSLHYNEYIVYETEKVHPKYLVKVQFTAEKYHENLK